MGDGDAASAAPLREGLGIQIVAAGIGLDALQQPFPLTQRMGDSGYIVSGFYILQQVPGWACAVGGDNRSEIGVPNHADGILPVLPVHCHADLTLQPMDGQFHRCAVARFFTGGKNGGQTSANQAKLLVGFLPNGLLKGMVLYGGDAAQENGGCQHLAQKETDRQTGRM